MASKHSYYSGNADHADKNRLYVATRREMLNWLLNGKLHVFSVDQRAEWLGESTLAGEGRIKMLADTKQLYCDNEGIYRLN